MISFKRLIAVGSTAFLSFVNFSESFPYFNTHIGLNNLHSLPRCETPVDHQMDANKKLIFSTVYFRHGTRTPLAKLKYFPDVLWDKEMCDVDTSQEYLPYKVINQHDGSESRPPSYYDELYRSVKLPGGCATGQLTRKGQNLSYNLGKMLRERYVFEHKLLDDKYDSEFIGAYSTNIDRTFDSMQAVLKGLFGESINKDNMAVIHTRPNQVDYNFPNNQFCEKIDKWMAYAYSSQYSLRVCDALREKLTQLFNNSSDIPQPISLWDSLVSMKSNDFDIPKHYEEIYDLVEKCAAHAEKYAVASDMPEFSKLLFGKVVDDIITHMENAVKHHDQINGSDSKYLKLWLTSCHDTTILSLLSTMGGFNEKWPPLSSYIAFELFLDSNDNNYYVRVIFNGEVVKSGRCDNLGFMKLDEFTKKHDKIRLREFDKDHFLPFPVPN